jgi:hypothetical protein
MDRGGGLDLVRYGRYGWVHDLVDDRHDIRALALARHDYLICLARYGDRTGTLADLVRAFCAARAGSAARYQQLAWYGVLFLRWELRFPEEWRESWNGSPWSAKEAVLATFCKCGPGSQTAPVLDDLLIAAVGRVQRCQDRWYWQLARRIATPELRARLADAADDAIERTRLRARFVLWVIDHPGERTGSAAWLRWRRTEGRPVTFPATAPILAAMKPAAAAAMLANLPATDLALVLEGLHAGPAARIVQQLQPAGLAARAVELMDNLIAARMLKTMDLPAAAGVLAAMTPDAAAARFPGPSRSQLLDLMGPDAAVARLQAMTPAAAGHRLQYHPPPSTAALLARLDPAFAANALPAIGSWGQRALTYMPQEAAVTLLRRLRAGPAGRVVTNASWGASRAAEASRYAQLVQLAAQPAAPAATPAAESMTDEDCL